MATPVLSILIVNWNSVGLLRDCLRSVARYAPAFPIEVVVVDNASYDGCAEMLAAEFPEVIFVQGPTNAGFARANNLAFRSCHGRVLLFLNPDTEVRAGAIERLALFVDRTEDAGAVGCRLLNSDGSVQTSCVQAYPTLLNQALDSEWLRRLAPRSKLWGMEALYPGSPDPAAVEVVSGACLAVSRGAFEAVGGFASDYFMYAEDLDLCYRLDCTGRTNYYVGDVEVVHHGGQSTASASKSQFGNVMMRESVSRFLARHRGPAYAAAYRTTTAAAAAVRIAAIVSVLALTLGQYRVEALLASLRKWRHVLRWTMGREGWAARMGAEAT